MGQRQIQKTWTRRARKGGGKKHQGDSDTVRLQLSATWERGHGPSGPPVNLPGGDEVGMESFCVLYSVESRSQNLKSIIRRDFDSIIDFKSIFSQIYEVQCPLI